MHQILFRLGLSPKPAGGANSAPPDPVAGYKGSTSKGRGGQVREGQGRGRRREGRRKEEEGEREGDYCLAAILENFKCPYLRNGTSDRLRV